MACYRVILVISIMFPLLFSPVNLNAAEQERTLVAKVGSINIANEDLQREIQKLIPMQVSYHGGIKPEKLEKIKKDALQNLINRAYKFQYAIQEEVSVDSQEFSASWNAYVQKMNAQNASPQVLEQVKAGFYQDMVAGKAEEQAVDAKVSVTDEEMKEFYGWDPAGVESEPKTGFPGA